MYESDPSLRSTRLAVSIITGSFIIGTFVQYFAKVRFESYTGFSLILYAAFIKAGSSLVKYLYQIRCNMVKGSTSGVSKFAIWSNFLGTIFCFIQLQIDSVIAGYAYFFTDPNVNVAKILVSSFGLLNTIVILAQIHWIYRSSDTLVRETNNPSVVVFEGSNMELGY